VIICNGRTDRTECVRGSEETDVTDRLSRDMLLVLYQVTATALGALSQFCLGVVNQFLN
jgi:hypothetical protein